MNKILFLDIETTGLNPWYDDKVTCICAKTSDNELSFKLCSEDERELLIKFNKFIQNFNDETILVHANGKEFDIPFLCARASMIFKRDYLIFNILRFKNHFDLCTDLTVGEWGKISLNKLAKIFNLPQKTAKGTDAIRWFKQKEFRLIEDYCWDDVLVTEKVYNKYMELKNAKM